jgi:hypothetical protein
MAASDAKVERALLAFLVLQPHHLLLEAWDVGRLRLRPVGDQLDRLIHVPLLHPVRLEGWGLVRDADVALDLGEDLLLPDALGR